MAKDEPTTEKLKGVVKEAAGELAGKDDTAKEGEEQQKKAQKEKEAQRLEDEAQHRRNQAAGHRAQERNADE